MLKNLSKLKIAWKLTLRIVEMTKKVDIVKVKSPAGWTPNIHNAVEEEKTENILHECDTQQQAIAWAENKGYEINIHRERNRKPADKHGQFRKQ